MLLASEKKKLNRIDEGLQPLRPLIQNAKSKVYIRQYADQLRQAVHLFEDIVGRLNKKGLELSGKDGQRLKSLFAEAIKVLGGLPDPNPVSLKQYEHDLHGPFLGVSDEGSAGSQIRKAALNTPKAQVLTHGTPIELGVALDAERLAAVGEVAVGPDEFENILIESQGSLLKTTNVGTRLNLRYFKQRPIIYIETGNFRIGFKKAIEEARTILEPFWHTPNGVSKALTVFFHFKKGIDFSRREEILKEIKKTFDSGEIGDSNVHRPGLMFTVSVNKTKVSTAQKNINLAHAAGIREVAVQGVPSWESETNISMPGLLNYFSSSQTNFILDYANQKNITLSAKNLVDPETIARHVWTGLQTARNMGLELGKYGLFPLTMEESEEVVSLMQRWFSDWSAAPVFYIDFPSVDNTNIYTEKHITKAVKLWLDRMAKHEVKIVLIDTADKAKGRKLPKKNVKDRVGILHIKQIKALDQYAKSKGIKCLWAGGITLPQAYEFGQLGVFGIYVTTAAAATIPAFGDYNNDPMITSVKEPTFEGVYTVKLLMEAGFISTRLREYEKENEASEIERKVRAILKWLSTEQEYPSSEEPLISDLHKAVADGWKIHYKMRGFTGHDD